MWFSKDLLINRNFKIPGLVAAVFLLLPEISARADGFFPMWQKAPPNAADTVLIYQGGSGRLPWTPDEFKPYVSYLDPRDQKEKWLFDAFLFIEFRDLKRTYSGTEGNGKWEPADKRLWMQLLNNNFAEDHGVPALETWCALTEKRLGAPLRPRQVILTLPDPVENYQNWGELDGHRMDFSVLADRVAACEWHIDQALKRWQALAPQHLKLAGFYFVPETITPANQQMLPVVAQKIHALGLKFFWIPFRGAKFAGEWKSLGFDIASQQPNYFFHPELTEPHLQSACNYAREHGMGLEMEFDDRLITQPAIYEPRFEGYLEAFSKNGIKDSAAMSYYEGGGTILHLSRAGNPAIHAHYDRIAQWVIDRQQVADAQFRHAN
jgi:hypothetical protein